MYKVVALCGSTKFKEDFLRVQVKLTLRGIIVISPVVFSHADDVEIDDKTRVKLENMHKQKIDMSDGIFVINKDGYIGESTKQEIAYAKLNSKAIEYLEPVK